jgi:hypothetical protein
MPWKEIEESNILFFDTDRFKFKCILRQPSTMQFKWARVMAKKLQRWNDDGIGFEFYCGSIIGDPSRWQVDPSEDEERNAVDEHIGECPTVDRP